MSDRLAVPKFVFQTWKTYDVPVQWKSLHAQWAKFCQKYKYIHVLFSDDDNRNFIREHYPWFLAKYDSYPYAIQRADVIRYFYGHKMGAIYVDLDIGPRPDRFEQLQNLFVFYSSLTESAAISETVNGRGKDLLTNSIMIIKQGSPFMAKLFEALPDPERFYSTPIKHVLAQTHKYLILCHTGPGVVNDCRVMYPDLLVPIPKQFLSCTISKEALVSHAVGGSWHNNKQMNKDILRLVMMAIGIILWLVVVLWVVRKCVKKYKKDT